MYADPTWQWSFTVLHSIVAVLVVYFAVRGPARVRDWREVAFRLAVLFSAPLGAIFFEPAIDRGGVLWYAEKGAWKISEIWGISIPLWVAVCYLWFLGGGALVIIQRVRAGAPTRQYLAIFAGIGVADLLMEVPILKFGKLFTYYGDTQPFYSQEWFPLPLWFLTTNRVLDLVPAFLVLLVMSAFRSKWIIATIPIVMVSGMYVSYAAVTWPTMTVLHNGGDRLETHLAAVLTIALGLGTTYLCAHLAPRMQHFMDHHTRQAPASEPAVPGGTASSHLMGS
jgi:hypothetical protein